MPQPPVPATRGSLLALGPERVEEVLREAVILATLITHPYLIRRFESAVERLELTGDGHLSLRAVILANTDADAGRLNEQLTNAAPDALDALFAQTHIQNAPPVRNTTDAELAMLGLAEELAKLEALRGARREIEDAVEDMSGLPDEGLTWRVSQSAFARHRADHPPREDANDLGEDRSALSKHLQNLIDGQVWVKKGR